MIARLRDGIRDGHPLSIAAGQAPQWFDPFDVALLDAGQQAGDLPATLRAAADHHQRAGKIGQRLFIALAYPGILAIAGIGVAMFLGNRVLPQLATLLQQAHQPVPDLTMAVISAAQILWWCWPLVTVLVAATVIGISRLLRRIPTESKLGRLVHGHSLARLRRRYRAGRFTWSLARLLSAGMTVTDALLVIAESLQDRPLRKLVIESQAAIVRGEDFSAVIARSSLLDPEVAQLIRIGERSGELVPMLEQIADHAFTAADAAMDRVAALIGPLAILMLAAIIGLLAVASILPLSRLGDML
jgi:type IV pilus assembly protein PilC